MQTCTRCNTTKPLDMFGFTKGKHADSIRYCSVIEGYRGICKACEAERARMFRSQHKNYRGSGKLKNIPSQDRALMSLIRSRITTSRCNNAKSGRPFDMDANLVYQLYKDQEGKCVYTGEEFTLIKGHPGNLSIDKIIPELGYVKGNLQLVCWAINRAKGDLSEEIFLSMCKVVHERATTIPKGSTPK